jgi:ABC-type transport system substrate-binding protein
VRYVQTRFLFGIAAAVALVAPSMGTAAARQPERHTDATSVLIYPAATADLWPKSLDPALTQDTTSMQVIGLVYSGLLKLNADDQVVPDLAAGMPTLSADKRTYTFKIRPDARFSDGTPVTAPDFVASWTRALSRQEQSPVAPAYMGGIVGAAALNAGKSHTLAGARAVDSRTVQVTFSAPGTYLLDAMTYPTWYVVKTGLAPGADLTTASAQQRNVGTGRSHSASPGAIARRCTLHPTHTGMPRSACRSGRSTCPSWPAWTPGTANIRPASYRSLPCRRSWCGWTSTSRISIPPRNW